MGAMRGAIVGRHRATQGLLERSISRDYQAFSYGERREPTAGLSFASREPRFTLRDCLVTDSWPSFGETEEVARLG